MPRIVAELAAGQMLRLQGPARLRVLDGQVIVLGAVFEKDAEADISEYRSYAVKALVDSRVELVLDNGASLEKPRPGEEVLDTWVALVDSMLRRGCRGFMILGPVDAGKSSLAALIANRSLLYGLRVGVVDADIGQADVGPPACVSAALVDKQLLWLREIRAERIRFIGYITPQRSERRIVAAVVDQVMWLKRRGAEVVVVDTDGWVQGINSIEYKLEAARFAGLDAVLVVGDETLYRMVEPWARLMRCGATLLPSPAVRRTRDRDDRRSLRGSRYRDFLGRLYERTLDLSRIGVQGSCFFSGARLPDETAAAYASVLRVPVEAASETYDTVYVVTVGQPEPGSVDKLAQALGKQVYILDKRLAEGALLALVGPSGEEEALGLLASIDLRVMQARVLTPYMGEVKGIILGGIRLTRELEETGRPLRCVI